MRDYEDEIKEKIKKGEALNTKFNFSVLKYFWESNISGKKHSDSVPRFLRTISILKNFSENELRILCNNMHRRHFSKGEVVFSQSQIGIGFYLIYSGEVQLMVEESYLQGKDTVTSQEESLLRLEKGDYFGELALLQEKNTRSVTAISTENSILLGLFRPDLDNLINLHTIIAAKLLQSISLIISERLFLLSQEYQSLKQRLEQIKRS